MHRLPRPALVGLAAWSTPLALLCARSGEHEVVRHDVERWIGCLQVQELVGPDHAARFGFLLARHPEFRTLLHHRLRHLPLPTRLALRRLLPPLPTLHLSSEHIGAGLFIQHGFATTVAAETVGEDCWINQQVTIGWTAHGRPVLGDRVRVGAGAVVVGPVTVGDDSAVGVNATVMRDVPPRTRVVAPLATSL